MEILWLVIASIIFIGCVIYIGYLQSVDPIDPVDVLFVMTMALVISATWPVLVGAAIVTSPFWIGWGFGKIKKKREAKRVEEL